MHGYPFNTWQTLLIIWAALLTLFLFFLIVLPEITSKLRETRARNRYLAQNARRRNIEQDRTPRSWL